MAHASLKFLTIPLLLIAATSLFAQTEPLAKQSTLDERIRAEVAQFKGKVSLFAKNLDTGAVYELGADDRVPTASTIKIAIMVEAFRASAKGR